MVVREKDLMKMMPNFNLQLRLFVVGLTESSKIVYSKRFARTTAITCTKKNFIVHILRGIEGYNCQFKFIFLGSI